MQRIFGLIPARMAASRFPGKPLYKIHDRPMIEHVYARAQMYPDWTDLALCTCDKEIEDFALSKDWKSIMTSDKHTRCLDRVAEAAEKLVSDIKEDDIIVCVQGDEPMLHPDMIKASIAPCLSDPEVPCTVLAMHITDKDQFENPNTVKIIHNIKGDVLYTSRSPVPYCKEFSAELEARRIYGIFAFRWHFLKTFTNMPESPLELKESCDSNRILDNGYKQRIAPYPFAPSFSVDSPEDIKLVEEGMQKDPLWGKY